jgi:DNA-binding NarL/FixJ family response regulator
MVKLKHNRSLAGLPNPLRLLLCDDSALVRSCVRRFLEGVATIDVVGEASGGIAGVKMALELQPDLILMDVSMPDLDGIEATRQIQDRLPGTHVVALSSDPSAETVEKMFAAGARGYLLKTDDPQEWIVGLQNVLAGSCFVGSGIRVARAKYRRHLK